MRYDAKSGSIRSVDPTFPPSDQKIFDVSAPLRVVKVKILQKSTIFGKKFRQNFSFLPMPIKKIISRRYKKRPYRLILTKFWYFKSDLKNIDFSLSYGLANFWPKIFSNFFLRFFWVFSKILSFWILIGTNMNESSI